MSDRFFFVSLSTGELESAASGVVESFVQAEIATEPRTNPKNILT
ncbi:MAG: hypothetical protein ACOYKN_13820 [Pirellula sp.]|jgi:hypothetical protein